MARRERRATRSGILKHSIPVAYISEDMAINQDIKALIPKEGIDYYYLLSYLKYKEKELVSAYVKTGTTVESIIMNLFLKLEVPFPSYEEQIRISKVWNLFESWWRKQAKAILQKRAEHWYPIIEKYGVAMPKVAVRKMKTLWGSCSVNRGAITLNFYLIKARMPYIDYVILHELTHFLYPNHSKQFYMFLSNYMPDWKERKCILDQEVVHGL